MMHSDRDVIVAPATPPQLRAPLAVIRVSGEGCLDFVARHFQPKGGPSPLRPRRSYYGDWRDPQGVVDDVVVVAYRAPRSYTGQDMAEITCHGNPLFVESIVDNALRWGARRARPGEFTMRALLNGKMDLLEAESVNALIEANTRYQANLARRQSKGPLVGFVNQQVEEILQIQAHIEATIDYGEEDIDALEREGLLAKMDGLIKAFARLAETAKFANGMRRGFRVLLTGEPNVGKSALFNALVRQERAIVAELPGTTRDLISEQVEIQGLPVVLIDSAGVRDTADQVETIGIEKIFKLLEDVDLAIHLDAGRGESRPYSQLTALPPEKRMQVRSKSDLADAAEKSGDGQPLWVSAKTGEGLDRLEREIVVRLAAAMEGQSVYLINQRQEETIAGVVAQLKQARDDYRAGFGEEILSSYLNASRRLLAELTGETTVEDILDRMFSNFCLGK